MRALVLVAALATLAAPAFADELPPLPAELPPLGPTVAPAAPRVIEERLPNGLTLWMVPRTGFPKVSVVMVYRTGRAADPPGKMGLAELLAAGLTQGARGMTAAQIAETLAVAGGGLRWGVRAMDTTLRADILAEGLPAALEVLAAVSTSATFPDAEMETQRRLSREWLRGAAADAGELAERTAGRMVGTPQPLDSWPSEAALKAATAANVRSAFRARIRPDESLLVLVGAIDVEATRERVRVLFGPWARPAAASRPLPPATLVREPGIYVVPRAGSVQTTVRILAPGVAENAADYAAWRLATMIFGGSWTSRLMTNLALAKGYTTEAFVSPWRVGSGTFNRGVTHTRTEQTGALLVEVLAELGRMATTEPPASDLELHRDALLLRLVLAWTRRQDVAEKLLDLWMLGLTPAVLEGFPAQIAKVTAADVRAAAVKYWSPSIVRIVAVGEADRIRKQLAPLGVPVRSLP